MKNYMRNCINCFHKDIKALMVLPETSRNVQKANDSLNYWSGMVQIADLTLDKQAARKLLLDSVKNWN
jgi:hypothetical protein